MDYRLPEWCNQYACLWGIRRKETGKLVDDEGFDCHPEKNIDGPWLNADKRTAEIAIKYWAAKHPQKVELYEPAEVIVGWNDMKEPE